MKRLITAIDFIFFDFAFDFFFSLYQLHIDERRKAQMCSKSNRTEDVCERERKIYLGKRWVALLVEKDKYQQ